MDWINFLIDNHVEFVERGPNTKRGEISIQCPYCGADDPSQHLGISLTTENWGCHRNGSHRGHAPSSLIAALLGCSFSQARLIARQYSRPDPSNLDEALAMLTDQINAPAANVMASKGLKIPPEFRHIGREGSTSKFWRYLQERGFDRIDRLCAQYELYGALTGDQKDRVIFPIYEDDYLIGWTGRAIRNPISAPRYLSSSAIVKKTIFNRDEIQKGGDLLFVVEGPFDALKLDYYGRQYGARATCVFGVTMTIDQISILASVRKNFKRVVVLFDLGAVEQTFEADDWLHAANLTTGRLPDGVKDPGEMNAQFIPDFIRSFK